MYLKLKNFWSVQKYVRKWKCAKVCASVKSVQVCESVYNCLHTLANLFTFVQTVPLLSCSTVPAILHTFVHLNTIMQTVPLLSCPTVPPVLLTLHTCTFSCKLCHCSAVQLLQPFAQLHTFIYFAHTFVHPKCVQKWWSAKKMG